MLEEGEKATATAKQEEEVKTILQPLEAELKGLAELLPTLLSTAFTAEIEGKKAPVLIKGVDVEGVEAVIDLVWERLSAKSSKTITLGQTRTPPDVREVLFSLAESGCGRGRGRGGGGGGGGGHSGSRTESGGNGDGDGDGEARVSRCIDPCCGSGVLLGAHVKRECARLNARYTSASGMLKALSRLVASTFGVDVDLASCVLSRFRVICCMVPTLVDAFVAARGDGDDGGKGRVFVPRLHIYNGDALLLYGGAAALRQTLVSGQKGFVDATSSTEKELPALLLDLDLGRFDLVFLNPPYRNLIRDYVRQQEQSSFQASVQVASGPW